MSLTRAEEPRWATGGLPVATLGGVVRSGSTLLLQRDRGRGVGSEIQWLDLEQVAVRLEDGQLRH
jgi:hypothetical protein